MAERLYRYEVDTDPAALEPGPMIVAFDGFFDAGMAQRLLVDHLLEVSEPTVVASFDVDSLVDYRSRRPVITFDANRYTDYNDPSMLLYHLTDRDGQSYYILAGPEPDYRWEAVISAVTTLMDEVGISLVVHAHGIPMAVPHSRPVGMTVHGSNERLIGEHKPVFGTVQVPASLAALLEMRLGESDRDAVGFSLHVPHYLAQSTFHDAALTALNAVVDVTGLNLANDALAEAAREGRLQIEREVEENDEVREAVQALERQYDVHLRGLERPSLLAGEGQDLPSADQLGAEFEDFLRTRDDSSDSK
ncbi:PAC2 family protein [Janibacter cremeus]|uniref:proteasome assembly chaperone family protein n=1 Tax=Janibacter cremeus TaxID=1285192 RepID=UPI0023F845ED|nr:PAC2 family protein [Janibacter cremeus]WEV78630.1 PAC2 family protein [Janibacter cremeus]